MCYIDVFFYVLHVITALFEAYEDDEEDIETSSIMTRNKPIRTRTKFSLKEMQTISDQFREKILGSDFVRRDAIKKVCNSKSIAKDLLERHGMRVLLQKIQNEKKKVLRSKGLIDY